VHLGTVFVNNQLDAQLFFMYVYFYPVHVSGSHAPIIRRINLLKPTGYMIHQQFNIQQLYALPTLYLCVLYLSENNQRFVPLIS